MNKIYPAIIWLIGFGLVLRYAMFDFVLRSDAGNEFSVYQLLVETGRWQIIQTHELLSACLFTSFFPAMLQRLFNTDLVMTYKLFPCFIMPILPVAVYLLARRWLDSHYAFLTSIFFMVQIYFLWAPSFARIVVSLSFFSLALLVVFNEKIGFKVKMCLMVVLSLCIVTAHYGTAFVGVFVLTATGVILLFLKRTKKYAYPYLRVFLSLTIVLGISTILWLGVINPVPVRVGQNVVKDSVALKTYGVEDSNAGSPNGDSADGETGDDSTVEEPTTEEPSSETERVHSYLSLEARETVIQVAFGKTFPDMNTPQRIEFVFSWLTILLMSWGLVLLLKNWGLKSEPVALMCVCYLTIVFSVIIPTIGIAYGIARVYFSMMVVLAPCFVVGAVALAKKIAVPRLVVVLVALVPYGLCASGVMHSFFGLAR